MIPDNIKKHRPKGTEIRFLGNHYYVYEITSVWDKEKKRSKKKTLGCIGKITEQDGFIPSKKKEPKIQNISVKEFGGFSLFHSLNSSLFDQLRISFPYEYKRIYTVSILRLLDSIPLGNIKTLYDKSYASIYFNHLALSENSIGSLLDYIGNNRERSITFMRNHLNDDEQLLIDGSSLFTSSNQIEIAKKGYNNKGKSKAQINLLYAFNKSTHKPSYYRLLPGNIVDKESFKNSINEMGINHCIIVADKGFYSDKNMNYLKEHELKFILPLKKNSKLISEYRKGMESKENYDGFFLYHKRAIWYKKYRKGNDYIFQYLDTERKQTKETEYLNKIENGYEGYTQASFFEKNKGFGVLYFISNMNYSPKEAYLTYKGRWEIEVSFNHLKNTLGLGKINVSSNVRVEGWAFINHISLMMYYNLYNRMQEADLLKKYSASEMISLAKSISVVYIDNKHSYISEMTVKEKELFKSLGVEFLLPNP